MRRLITLAVIALTLAAPATALASFTMYGAVGDNNHVQPYSHVTLYQDNLAITSTNADANGTFVIYRIPNSHYYQVNATKCVSHSYEYGWFPNSPVFLNPSPGTNVQWIVIMNKVAGPC